MGNPIVISVASGKGGTGKTTVSVNLALSIGEDLMFLDCDVEEPNGHFFLKPRINQQTAASIPVPQADLSRCLYCGKCADICVYNALAVIPKDEDSMGHWMLFPHLCHGCGACSHLCPESAITEIPKEIGVVEIGKSGNIGFVHGKLNVGEVMSPPLIREVKKYSGKKPVTIIDAPPGTSCPVIAAIQESDYCLLVTEPTPFGLHDLTLSVDVLKKMDIPFGVIINRSDLGDGKTEAYCSKENIPILMKIPFSREIAQWYSKGISMVEGDRDYREKFLSVFEKITGQIERRTS